MPAQDPPQQPNHPASRPSYRGNKNNNHHQSRTSPVGLTGRALAASVERLAYVEHRLTQHQHSQQNTGRVEKPYRKPRPSRRQRQEAKQTQPSSTPASSTQESSSGRTKYNPRYDRDHERVTSTSSTPPKDNPSSLDATLFPPSSLDVDTLSQDDKDRLLRELLNHVPGRFNRLASPLPAYSPEPKDVDGDIVLGNSEPPRATPEKQ